MYAEAARVLSDGPVELYSKIGTEGYADTPRSPSTTTPTTLKTYTADTLRPMLDETAAPAAG